MGIYIHNVDFSSLVQDTIMHELYIIHMLIYDDIYTKL